MLQAIMQELAMQSGYLAGIPVETIYFGGGTPSLLTADEINRITEQIFRHYTINQLKEFTLETNPDDLSVSYTQSLRHTQVNRFSIGTQSFRDDDLKYMNRAHNAQQADYAIKAAQDAGFTNLTIDLIYGTPGLSDADWKYNLNKVNALSIPHYSAYALTVEEGTLLHHNISKKKTLPVDAEQSAAQFEILMTHAAENDYEHYEISNLAMNGMYAIHNTNYWKGVPYLGIGPSAHSFNGTTRQWNIANNSLYIKSLLQEHTVPFEVETLTTEQQLNEYIMTSLRTMWGCDTHRLGDYASQVIHAAQPFIDNGQLLQNNHTLILTNKGRLVADHVAASLFV